MAESGTSEPAGGFTRKILSKPSSRSSSAARTAVAASANMRVISVLMSAPCENCCDGGSSAVGRVAVGSPGGAFGKAVHGNDGGNQQDHLDAVDRQIGRQNAATVKRCQ